MRFTPKTEQQIKEESTKLLPKGDYDFEIVKAEEKVSRSGNPMIELMLKVFNDHGDESLIFDYLLESMAYKLRHCAVACGLEHEYTSGVLDAENFVGRTGRLKLVHQEDKTGKYGTRNSVQDYYTDSKTNTVVDKDDSIPF